MKPALASFVLALAAGALTDPGDNEGATGAQRQTYLKAVVERYARRFEVLQDSACFVESTTQRLKPRPPEAVARSLLDEWDAYFGDAWLQTLKDLRDDLDGALAGATTGEAEQELLALDGMLRQDRQAVTKRLEQVLGPPGAKDPRGQGATELLARTRQALVAARASWGRPARSLDPGPTARAEVGKREGATYISQTSGFRCDLPKDWKLSTLGIDPWQRLRLRPPDGAARLVIALRSESFPDAADAQALYRAIEHRAHEEWPGYRRIEAARIEHQHWSGGYRLRFVMQQPKESQHGLAYYLHDADTTRTTGLLALGTEEALKAHQALIEGLLASLRGTE